MNKKIIFFDIDGTLFTPEIGHVTRPVVDRIHEAQQMGNLCVIATGRPFGFLPAEIFRIGFDGFITTNGGQIQMHGENLYVNMLPKSELTGLKKVLDAEKAEYIFLDDKACYIPSEFHDIENYYRYYHIETERFIHDYDAEEVMDHTMKIEAICRDPEGMQRIVDYLNTCNGLTYDFNTNDFCVEIYAKGCTKATGIQDLLQILHIDKKDSICFGDGLNDLEMFQTVGYPVAMGNAVDTLKGYASDICPSILEDGVAVKMAEIFHL